MDILKRVSSDESKLTYKVNGQSIQFAFSDSDGEIISWSIPFTFNINGCWWGNQKSVEPWEGQKTLLQSEREGEEGKRCWNFVVLSGT